MKETAETIYNRMRDEIRTLGWSGVLEKYHPDNNIGDSNAFEKFKIYKSVYRTMKVEAKNAYVSNQRFFLEDQSRAQADIISNYETIVRRFFVLSIVIVIFVILMIGIRAI